MDDNTRWDSIAVRQSANGSSPATVIGYASCALPGRVAALELKEQAEKITGECKRRGLDLLEVVGEHSPKPGKASSRPGFEYALGQIDSGAASGLVVMELSRLTQSMTELGTILAWLLERDVRVVASVDELDTGSESGRLAANLLVSVSRWERSRISERTRQGLEVARTNGRLVGRPAVADDPGLSQRIATMRAEGMTLQAIADLLNDEGVPTLRGGVKWRHSSVQAAVGYRRGGRARPASKSFAVGELTSG